jgi:hypothetical protein
MRRSSFIQRIATAVSGLDLRHDGTSNRAGASEAVARSSQKHGSVRSPIHVACALAAMTAASCLITTDPEFEPPARTAPFFLPDTATPTAERLVQILPGENGTLFTAQFRSEDAGSPVVGQFYLDHGVDNDLFNYAASIDVNVPEDVGAWSDKPRSVVATFNRQQFSPTVGCHRFTLLIAHDSITQAGCPAEAGDYDTQTWLVQICAEDPCEPLAGVCPPVTRTCPKAGESTGTSTSTGTGMAGSPPEGGSP